jgi:quercetin dioxygenase-like cupin family protein
MIVARKLDFKEFHKTWIRDVLSRWDGRPVAHSGQNSYELDPENYQLLVDEVSEGRELFQIRGVMLPPGNQIKVHHHPKWEVVMYFPMNSSGCLILHNPEFEILTEEGMCYAMEIGRVHSVTKNEDAEPRVTLAMLFLPHD